jgi:ribose transport system ATP-binding protein/rhamnose transport system ATP-binding protein
MTETSVPGAPQGAPFLTVSEIRKSFGGVQALKGVSLDLRAGEVHGLVGANGAGKSTMIRILAGLDRPDSGRIEIDGHSIAIENPHRATALGLGFIHQELALVPRMNALENIMLGAPKESRFGLLSWGAVAERVKPIAERAGIAFPLDSPIAKLSTAERWLVSICRALVRKCRLIVMDEPTASLSVHEVERLFAIIRELSKGNVAVLYVSHRLDEITALCDRVTVFRDGRSVMDVQRDRLTRRDLVEAIVGGAVAAPERGPARPRDGIRVLEIRDLHRHPHVRGASLDLHAGEVLGLGGLVGAGRSELVRILFGADHAESGSITYEGRPFAPRSPAAAMQAGVAFIPEERRAEGLILNKSIAFNFGLANLQKLRVSPGLPLIKMARRGRMAGEMMQQLQVKAPNADTAVGRLSGGNQQKVVIGKWLSRRPRVLILDEPTRGVDIGARAEIHRLIRNLAADGVAVIVISSEAEELPELCDRVLVMAEGRVVKELAGAEMTRANIVQASYAETHTSQQALSA